MQPSSFNLIGTTNQQTASARSLSSPTPLSSIQFAVNQTALDRLAQIAAFSPLQLTNRLSSLAEFAKSRPEFCQYPTKTLGVLESIF